MGAGNDAVHHLFRRVGEDRPQRFREMLRSFPEVTVVASELGQPDDGTGSDRFFNVEDFSSGLKPYSPWTGLIAPKLR